MHPLYFQHAEEAFHHRVVGAVARAAHADLYVVRGEQLLIRLAGVLTPPVGMNKEFGLWPGLPPGHAKRIADERGSHDLLALLEPGKAPTRCQLALNNR